MIIGIPYVSPLHGWREAAEHPNYESDYGCIRFSDVYKTTSCPL